MRHQTSCDNNETKNPREYLLARRASVTSPSTAPSSPMSPTPPSNMGIVSSKPPSSPFNRNSESPAKTPTRTLRTPPHSPSLRSRPSTSPITPPRSPSSSSASPQPSSGLSEGYESAFTSRNNSVSPGLTSSSSSRSSTSSSSSGGSSGISSISGSSGCTTPNTSSSASPIPVTNQPGTPTDIEADIEEEEVPFPRPRKGRLLSSAIISWRSIGGGPGTKLSNKDRPNKYQRSNTAPLRVVDLNDEEDELTTSPSKGVTNSRSATNVTKPPLDDSEEESLPPKEPPKPPVFKRNRNKYPAPPPPRPPPKTTEINTAVSPIINKPSESKERLFKFDSVPVMDGQKSVKNDVIPCEFCKQVFHPEKFRAHQVTCWLNAICRKR